MTARENRGLEVDPLYNWGKIARFTTVKLILDHFLDQKIAKIFTFSRFFRFLLCSI